MREIFGREITVDDVYEFIVDQRENALRMADKYRLDNPDWYRDSLVLADAHQLTIAWIEQNR